MNAEVVDERYEPENNLHSLKVELTFDGSTRSKWFNFEPEQTRDGRHKKAIKRWADKVKSNQKEEDPDGKMGEVIDV